MPIRKLTTHSGEMPESLKSQLGAETTQLQLAVTSALMNFLGGDDNEQVLLGNLCMSIPRATGTHKSNSLSELLKNGISYDKSVYNQVSFITESIIASLRNFSQIQGSKYLFNLFYSIQDLHSFWRKQEEINNQLREAVLSIPIDMVLQLEDTTLSIYIELMNEYARENSSVGELARNRMNTLISRLGINSYELLGYINGMCKKLVLEELKKVLTPFVVKEIYDIVDGKRKFIHHPDPGTLPVIQEIVRKIEMFDTVFI